MTPPQHLIVGCNGDCWLLGLFLSLYVSIQALNKFSEPVLGMSSVQLLLFCMQHTEDTLCNDSPLPLSSSHYLLEGNLLFPCYLIALHTNVS
jgi:hypothetical protein